ncbi:CvpA family protein [Pseudodesulfovibrio cashew]|uniref:CvpA family protein n=1 Tax=Pseudodesulfovibrio cashew TaxID=2678688 RepID=A0A6I6JK54_9BACT|nr:CvpA family protein [Pseudodesulfovibrio cashew]QGY41539.1 CvpA family protein [Pseudodesulfovibrio cashew]
MNFLDIILICVAALFVLRGFFRGLVKEVISLTAIILAIYLASNFQYLLVPHLELYIDSKVTVSALSYVVIFFGTLIVCWGIAKIIRTMLDIALLGWADRAAGGVFGLIEGVLIGLIILIAMQSFAPESKVLKDSVIAPRAQHMVKLVGDLAPQSMRDVFESRGFSLPSRESMLDTARQTMGLDDEEDTGQ